MSSSMITERAEKLVTNAVTLLRLDVEMPLVTAPSKTKEGSGNLKAGIPIGTLMSSGKAVAPETSIQQQQQQSLVDRWFDVDTISEVRLEGVSNTLQYWGDQIEGVHEPQDMNTRSIGDDTKVLSKMVVDSQFVASPPSPTMGSDLDEEAELKRCIALSLGLEEEMEIYGENGVDSSNSLDEIELERALAMSMETPSAQMMGVQEIVQPVKHETLVSTEDSSGYSLDQARKAALHALDLAHAGEDFPFALLADVCHDGDMAMLIYEELRDNITISSCRFLSFLAEDLISRFRNWGEPAHIDKALALIAKAKGLIGTIDDIAVIDIVQVLNIEGYAYIRQFKHWGNPDDTEKAITAWQTALDLMDDNKPNGTPDRQSLLNNLGNALLNRSEWLGSLVDIDNAILNHQQAVDLTSDDDAEKSSRLNNLGNSLLARFKQLGNGVDLDHAILRYQKAVELMPDGHLDKPGLLSNVGSSLRTRFERLGNLVDIDDAIRIQMEAVDLTPDGHAFRATQLSNLGNSFLARFERLENLTDINHAILSYEQAINLTPDRHATKPARLNNLANSLLMRFQRMKDLVDIDDAIARHKQAVDLTPKGHPDKPARLNNLGTSLFTRFERTGQLMDINDAIVRNRQAVYLTSDGDPDKPARLNNLANALLARFEQSINPIDIDEAILIYKQAVDLTPDEHAHKPAQLCNFAACLKIRYMHDQDPDDLRCLISSSRKAAFFTSGPPTYRFRAARLWASFSHSDLEAHRAVVNLIPQLVWLGRTVEERYGDLQTIGDAIVNAVSAACAAGEDDLALEWFEQGRAIIWGQILRLRSPMDDLRTASPELFNQLNATARELEKASTSGPALDGSTQKLEQIAQAHRRLAEKWESLLATVRALPGLGDFLQATPASILKKASVKGVIIVVNVSEYGSDALILQSPTSSIERVALPGLSLKNVTSAQTAVARSLRLAGVRFRDVERATSCGGPQFRGALSNVLKMLWNDLAKPILEHFGFESPLSEGACLQVTWCLSGPLASLPVHAAGIYDSQGGQDKLFNYLISSYTPSLGSLLQGLDKKPNTPSLLAVTQQDTPKLSPLPGTMIEVDQVQGQMNSHRVQMTRMDGGQATVAAVSETMNSHSWIHLSCHGKQDPLEPTKSAFFLHDGKLELGEIMKKSLKHAELAYLSACQTASGDEKMPDEAVHLAAGMFTAGYRSVVATLWSIRDKDAPLVAEVFYDHLLSNPKGGVAQALHDAVGALRAQVGDTDLLSWVPYIHIGH